MQEIGKNIFKSIDRDPFNRADIIIREHLAVFVINHLETHTC